MVCAKIRYNKAKTKKVGKNLDSVIYLILNFKSFILSWGVFRIRRQNFTYEIFKSKSFKSNCYCDVYF